MSEVKIKNMQQLILFLCVVVSLFGLSCGSSASMQNQSLIEKSSQAISSNQENSSKIPSDLIQQLITDINTNENNFHLSKKELEVLNNHLQYELHDLNNDGVLEFFLYIEHSDWCGAGGNCSYWVYQKTTAGYKLLLEDKLLTVKDNVTNGYRDLSSKTPMGFCDKNVGRFSVTQYKYDGKEYQPQTTLLECIAIKQQQN